MYSIIFSQVAVLLEWPFVICVFSFLFFDNEVVNYNY